MNNKNGTYLDTNSSVKDIRFRFAPSPTGGLHIGTARTALFNWLAAKSMGGKLILRIEDTDIQRSKKIFEESIIQDLNWLGITWDEFYRQSERIDIYKKYAEELVKKEKAYFCFCSNERLEELKEKQYLEGKPSKYDNKCRNLSKEEIENNLKANKPYAIRFKILEGEIIFNDIVRGIIKFNSDVFGDFVILKSDGTPSYNFAVVVDDWEMKITHVLRGEDHITNTARQIMIFKSLGFSIPEFAHLSMILGKDGKKLSKRHGAKTISEFREEGYLSEAMVNYLALLSWSPKEEIFLLKNVINDFNIKDISKNPAIFDIEKLNWVNSHHIRNRSNKELLEELYIFIKSNSFFKNFDLNSDINKEKINRCLNVYKEKLKTLKEFPDYIKVYFDYNLKDFDDEALEIIKDKNSREVIIKIRDIMLSLTNEIFGNKKSKEDLYLEAKEDFFKQILSHTSNQLYEKNIKGKNFYMPIRSALIGKAHGPEIPKVMYVLGIDECLNRLDKVINYLMVKNI